MEMGVRFCSEVELARFLSNIDIIPYAFGAIPEMSEEKLTYKLHTGLYGIKVLAFNCTTDYTTPFVNHEFHLVSSQDHKVVDFISTKLKPSFSINKAAVELFEHLIKTNKMKELERMSVGCHWMGYLAILFTLWRQNTIFEDEYKRPICITFGSPLIGDEALQQAISERPQWESCFLNVVAMTDYVAGFVPSNGEYKPFGSFLFCTESGGHAAFEDPEAILAVLNAMALPMDTNLEKHDYGKNLSLIRRKKALHRGISCELNMKPLTEGIKLQFKDIGVLEKISDDLINEMELKQEKMIKRKNMYEPTMKLNDMKISMTYIEWYIKERKSEGGYYDCYKKEPQTRKEMDGYQEIITQVGKLNQYWEKFVEEKDQNPQKEGAKLHKRWLYSGTIYRRMIELLTITKVAKQTTLRIEEALISLNVLKINESSNVNGDNIEEKELEKFMKDVMCAINGYFVSPDIFKDGSSLMKWWSEYDAYKKEVTTTNSKFWGDDEGNIERVCYPSLPDHRKKMSQNMSCSGVEVAKFFSSIDVIPYAFGATRVLPEDSEKNLTYELHTGPYGVKVLAFNCKSSYTTRFVNGEDDLVLSKDHEVVNFISTKLKPSFSINKVAVEMFEHLIENEMKELEREDLKSPLIVTGWGLGGYLAILTTLWLQKTMYKEESKRPICITFGSPLIGDEDLQKAISQRPQWESCFLNVVAMTDYVAGFVPSKSKDKYKPFGSFLFCTESGGHAAFEDPEAILAVLNTMVLPRDANLGKHDYENDLKSIRRKKVLCRGVSESDEFNSKPLSEGIRLQFKEIGVLEKISNDLIKHVESKQEKMIKRKKITYEPTLKLNDMKISMACMEWYIKTRKSEGGYYDCYKKELQLRKEIEGHQEIIKLVGKLIQYWEKFVEEKDQNPQKEGVKLRTRWLYSGNNYIRMIEPLVIAKHYKDGKTDYIKIRSNHYKLLEAWFKEDQRDMNPSAEKTKAPNLTDDSCFWAHVEEALILLNALKINESSHVNGNNIEQKLEQFMDYLMCAINDYSVSPDIFEDGSSLRKWWNEYDTYKQGSCTSEFAQYMNSGKYASYKGSKLLGLSASSSAKWWTPLFRVSSDPDYIHNPADESVTGNSDPDKGRSRFAPGCFTEEKAKQMRCG
ncbi:hypothetical protein L1987_67011 [Smallanthus sonchifolius]|uniref:Uncharacterized protein n=1 Tax=Smallanthus sonchifolius TaxID=185202 RepID=A0ACB9BZ18_9ASTR|nr:hypothetical protein L1987_67011 [Smallanthus sonchifolius]